MDNGKMSNNCNSVQTEDLFSELQAFDIGIEEDALYKLKELCLCYHQSAEEMVEQIVAYSCSHSYSELSIDNVDSFHKEFLCKDAHESSPKSNSHVEDATAEESIDEELQENVLDVYLTPDVKREKYQRTPENSNNKKVSAVARSPLIPFSPASFSPVSATPSGKYGSRLNSRDVVCSFGDTENVNWKATKRNQSSNTSISTMNSYSSNEEFHYMFEKLRNKAEILSDLIDDMSEHLNNEYNVNYWSRLRQVNSDEVHVVGRICCDSNGKMNANSLLLEGSVENSEGETVHLDVQHLPKFSFIPGQIVGFSGVNLDGRVFSAKKLLNPKALPFFNDSKVSVGVNGDLQVALACGPFTTRDALCYDPFYDFIKYLDESKPDVCILIGPFIDEKNEEVANDNLNEGYHEVFGRIISDLLKSTESFGMQVVLVPSSQRDVHHDSNFPTRPFVMNDLRCERLHLVTDPCMLKINGIIFGVTSVDILLHIGKEELNFPPASTDRLKRLANHVVTQHSFYPLYPSSEDTFIDYERFVEYVCFPFTPHVLILPSDLRNFIKDVDGCCCINPERLTKGMLGGTFARLNIKASSTESSVISRIVAEIVRI